MNAYVKAIFIFSKRTTAKKILSIECKGTNYKVVSRERERERERNVMGALHFDSRTL